MQFLKLPKLNDEKWTSLTSNEKIIFAEILDRMESSKKNMNFFDKKKQDFYVIYTRDELIKVIGVSEHTVTNALKHLAEAGFIETKRGFNSANRIFITYVFEEKNVTETHKAENESTEGQNMNINQTDQAINNTNNTVNTETHKLDSKIEAINRWKQATQAKLGLPKSTVDLIANSVSYDLNQCYKVIKLISNARSAVVKANGLTKSAVTQFETNDTIQKTITTKIRNVFGYIKQKGMNEFAGYFVNSFKKYFLDVMGLKADEPEHVAPKAPRKNRIVETLPDWAKEDNTKARKSTPLTPQQEAKLKMRLAQLANC